MQTLVHGFCRPTYFFFFFSGFYVDRIQNAKDILRTGLNNPARMDWDLCRLVRPENNGANQPRYPITITLKKKLGKHSLHNRRARDVAFTLRRSQRLPPWRHRRPKRQQQLSRRHAAGPPQQQLGVAASTYASSARHRPQFGLRVLNGTVYLPDFKTCNSIQSLVLFFLFLVDCACIHFDLNSVLKKENILILILICFWKLIIASIDVFDVFMIIGLLHLILIMVIAKCILTRKIN